MYRLVPGSVVKNHCVFKAKKEKKNTIKSFAEFHIYEQGSRKNNNNNKNQEDSKKAEFQNKLSWARTPRQSSNKMNNDNSDGHCFGFA